MPTLILSRLQERVKRARSAVGKGTTYHLGSGGYDPGADLPGDSSGRCDCSGFLAWAFHLSRKPKASRPFWIETSAIVADAKGPGKTFMRASNPVPGCAVVYGDSGGRQGHCGIVTGITVKGGKVTAIRGVDCSSGQSRATGEAIHERDLSFFIREGAIYVVLAEDVKEDGR